MAAAAVPRPPRCPTPDTEAHNNQPTCFATDRCVKSTRKIPVLLLIILLNTQRVDDDDTVAGNNDACSFVWGVSGGFDAIASSYGPIGSIPWLSFGGGGEECSQNMGNTEAILGEQKSYILTLGRQYCRANPIPKRRPNRVRAASPMVLV